MDEKVDLIATICIKVGMGEDFEGIGGSLAASSCEDCDWILFIHREVKPT
jgi:hypothetical protein